MDAIEKLFYALGEFAYAIAMADGKIQEEEKKALRMMLEKEFKNLEEYNFSEIVFEILQKDKTADVESAYQIALRELKLNGHYLSPELKEKFLRILQKVSDAFPPRTKREAEIIDKLQKDIYNIKGDPIFYAPHQIDKP